jgi:hypothetical protein
MGLAGDNETAALEKAAAVRSAAWPLQKLSLIHLPTREI